MTKLIKKTQSIISLLMVSTFLLFVMFPVALVLSLTSLRFKLSIIGPMWGLACHVIIRYGALSKYQIFDRRDQLEQNKKVGSSLYISNHMSFVDVPLIGTTLQLPPIMKKEVLYIPIFGLIGWSAGSLVVNRSKGSSRRKIFMKAKKRMLNDGVGLQFYPEGTRSKDHRPKDFEAIKKPILYFAFEENISVYPISLFGTDKVLAKNKSINLEKKLAAIFHAKVNPKDFKDKDEFAKACWEKVKSGFYELEKLILG